MSITSPDDRISEYNPVVATTDFPAGFPVFDNDDIAVYLDGVERVDFTISATYVEGVSINARAVFAVGITGKVEVVGSRDPRRTNLFQAGGALPIRDQNLALNTIVAEIQEARRDIERSFKVPYGVTPPAVPQPSDQMVLGWVGNNLQNLDPAQFVNMAGTATAAQGAKADNAVQRAGNEVKTGDLRISDGLLKTFKNLQTIPTTADNIGMIVSHNRSNADGETNIRNMYVNGVGMNKAFVWSQITTAGSAEVDLLTLYRNGRAAVGSIGWLEAIAGQAETVSMFTSLSKPGTALAVTGASRTSDAVAPAYFSGIGVWGFSHNNRARTGDFNTTFMGWGGYFENRRDNGSGRSHGVEIGSVNMGAAGVDPEVSLMTPYDYAQVNSINGLLLSAGRPDVGAGQHDISNAMNVIANGAKYRTGIVFGNGSVAADGPTVPAILMPTLYGFRWYTAEGLRAYFHADQSAGSQTTLRLKTNEIRALNTNGGFDAGATYIGNTTASRQFRLATFDASFPNLYLEINTNTTASPTWTNRGQFNAATGVYSSVSDERLKENFRPFGRSALDTVSGLASASSHYSMIGDDREHFGYLAGRVLSVFPEGVDATGENLMVSDRPISALHSLAIDELKQRIEILEKAACPRSA
ncbi:tail fiber domain-containing protein [Pararhizobium sp. DWP3-4]|uniref:tail fiber domain-containing protein n=1 Tax=Pararhizobium sp. DWP3-4 TaxID=2804565 RepID=UPI003CED56DA